MAPGQDSKFWTHLDWIACSTKHYQVESGFGSLRSLEKNDKSKFCSRDIAAARRISPAIEQTL